MHSINAIYDIFTHLGWWVIRITFLILIFKTSGTVIVDLRTSHNLRKRSHWLTHKNFMNNSQIRTIIPESLQKITNNKEIDT